MSCREEGNYHKILISNRGVEMMSDRCNCDLAGCAKGHKVVSESEIELLQT